MTSIQKKIPNIILIILILAMILALTYQGYRLFESRQNTAVALSEGQNKPSTAPSKKQQHDLAKFELFGTPTQETKQQVVTETTNLPKTNLRLVLRGVSASTNTDTASALIEGPDKQTLNYGVDDTLPGNAKLKSVYQNRVVIERSGRLENLYFPDNESIGIVSNDSARQNQATPKRSASTANYSPPTQQIPQNYQRPSPNLDTLSDQRKQDIKRKLEQLRERMQQAPN